MLKLAPPNHHHKHFLNLSVLVFLLAEVRHDGVHGHLTANSKPPLELFLNSVKILLLLFRCEALGPGKVSGLGSG